MAACCCPALGVPPRAGPSCRPPLSRCQRNPKPGSFRPGPHCKRKIFSGSEIGADWNPVRKCVLQKKGRKKGVLSSVSPRWSLTTVSRATRACLGSDCEPVVVENGRISRSFDGSLPDMPSSTSGEFVERFDPRSNALEGGANSEGNRVFKVRPKRRLMKKRPDVESCLPSVHDFSRDDFIAWAEIMSKNDGIVNSIRLEKFVQNKSFHEDAKATYHSHVSSFSEFQAVEEKPMNSREKRERRREKERAWQKMVSRISNSNLSNRDKADVALEMVRILSGAQHVSVNPRHISTALSVCLASGQVTQAEAILDFVVSTGLKDALNCHVYAFLVQIYCTRGLRDKAFSLVQAMESEGIFPDVVIFNILLMTEKRYDGLCEIFSLMEKFSVSPNERTYSLAFRLLGRLGMIEEMENLYQKMLTDGIKPTIFTYNSIMNAFADREDLSKCFEILQEMRRMKIDPTICTYNTVLKAYCMKNETYDMDSVLDGFLLEGDEKVKAFHQTPDVLTYNILMNALIKKRKSRNAISLFNDMIQKDIHPSLVTYATLLRAAGHLRNFEEVTRILEEMKEKNISHNAITYRCLIHAFVRCGKGDYALAYLEEMKKKGFEPCMQVTDILIKSVDSVLFLSCTQETSPKNIRTFVSEMMKAGLTPTISTAGKLVSRLVFSHGLKTSLDVYQELYDANVRCLGNNVWKSVVRYLKFSYEKNRPETSRNMKRLFSVFQMDNCILERNDLEIGVESCIMARDAESALLFYDHLKEREEKDSLQNVSKSSTYYSSIQKLLLKTVDVALIDVIAQNISTSNLTDFSENSFEPQLYPTSDRALDLEPELEDQRNLNTIKIMEDLASAGIRLKPVALSNVIQQLVENDKKRFDSHDSCSFTLRKPSLRRNTESQGGEKFDADPSFSGDEKGNLSNALRRNNSWLNKALGLMKSLPRMFDVKPTSFVYSSLMQLCIKEGEWEQVDALWDGMLLQNIEPDASAWNAKFYYLSKSTNILGRSEELVNQMLLLNAKLDESVVRDLLENCHKAKDFDGARYLRSVLHAMEQKSVK